MGESQEHKTKGGEGNCKKKVWMYDTVHPGMAVNNKDYEARLTNWVQITHTCQLCVSERVT